MIPVESRLDEILMEHTISRGSLLGDDESVIGAIRVSRFASCFSLRYPVFSLHRLKILKIRAKKEIKKMTRDMILVSK